MKTKKLVWVRCSLPRSLQFYAKGVIEAVSDKFSDTCAFRIIDIASGKWYLYSRVSGVYVRKDTGKLADADTCSGDYLKRVHALLKETADLCVLVWDNDDLPAGITEPSWTVLGLYMKKVSQGSFKVEGKTKSWIVIWKNSRGGISWQDVSP